MVDAESGRATERADDECPQCQSSGMTAENPILEDTYECANCLIAFTADGEVLKS